MSAGDAGAWREKLYDAKPERQGELFSTMSGVENEPLYTPDSELDYARDLGYPGVYPFTRGVYPSMYRGRLWTMRQFAGFGTAEETNERFRYLLEHGQTGLSTAFDMPTLMGLDSDHPRSLGEVGREGVAVDSLADVETLFAGIPLADVSTSMTINAPAAMLLAFYACVGEQQGAPMGALRGTIQTDILKEYIAQKEWIFPPEPSMRLVTDMIEFCSTDMPLWHPVSISGYHIREAGSDAPEELAVTPADGVAYVEAGLGAGLGIERAAGARVHAGGWVRLRGGGHRAGSGYRRLRAAAELLLQRAPRLLRRDREVPRRPPDLGARAAREVRREEPALLADALPHADRGGLADGAAARGEHRPHRARGDGGRARRHAVAAHELLRRGARAADGERRPDRAPHAAGDRPRDRRREHDRPARRLLVRRAADERARAPGLRVLPADRAARRRRRGDQGELLPARDRGRVVPLPVRGRGEAADRRRRQPLRARGRGRAGAAARRPGARGQAGRAGAGRAGAAGRGGGRADARRAPGRGRGGAREPDAADRRGVEGVRDDGRDVRRAPRGLGRLARDPGFLTSLTSRRATGYRNTARCAPTARPPGRRRPARARRRAGAR